MGNALAIKLAQPIPWIIKSSIKKKDDMGYDYISTHKMHNWDFQTKVVQSKEAKILQTAALFGAKHIRVRVGEMPWL
jgi:hypothetical protein